MDDDKDSNSIYCAEISHPSWDAPIISFGDFHIEPPRRIYSGFLPPRISSMEYSQMQNLPKCRVLLHPIVRNYWAIAIIEHDARRTAVIRNGYVELVAK